MIYKTVSAQIITLLFFCTTLLSFANNELDDKINTILESKSIENTEKFNKIMTIVENSTALTELEQSQYYHDISKLFYGKYKALQLAIKSVKKAVIIRRKYKDTNPDLLKKSLFNLGVFYNKSGAINAWYKTYKELLTTGTEDRRHAKVYVAFGKFYRKTGDFAKALENLEKAQRYFVANNDRRELFLTHLSFSYLYANMGRIEYSKEIINHLEQADSINTTFSNSKNRIAKESDLFIIKQRLGNLALEKDEFNKAEKKLKEALVIALKQKDTSNIALVYSNLSNIYIEKKEHAKTLKTLQKAKSLANSNIIKSLINNNLGDYYFNTKDYKNAEISYLSAFNGLNNITENRLPKESELSNVPNKLDALSYLKDIAGFYYKQYQLNNDKKLLQKALEAIIMADKLVDIIRLGSTENMSKLIWRERGAGIYMKGVEIAYLLNKPAQAFYFMEKNKGLLLLEDLTAQQARKASKLPDSIIIKELNFNSKIKETEISLANENISKDREQLKNKLFTLKREYQFFTDTLKINYPNYFKSKQDIKITSINAIDPSILKDNTAIIEFILDDNQGYAIAKTRSRIKLIKLKDIKTLNKEVKTLKTLISKPFYDESSFKNFNNLAIEVYKTLFKELENIIKDKAELIIIPDYTLAYIPFEVLQTHRNGNPLLPNYLLYTKYISYAYSVNFLLQNDKVNRNPKSNFLALAPIEFNSELTKLTDSEIEIDNINTLLDGTILKREEATKQNFLSLLNNYNIIHISTHADYDKDKTTWLWFADKKMKQTELYTIKSQADMVVLSACKTLDGEMVKGEGLNSLSRGFFSAGAKSVLSSLWNTNDKSNTDIMIAFYKELKNNTQKNIALANAKKEYLKKHFGIENSPYYWASNTINGSIETKMITSKLNYSYYILSTLVVLSLIIFTILKLKK